MNLTETCLNSTHQDIITLPV